MKGLLIRLVDAERRALAKRLVDEAPEGYEVNIREPKRTLDQNAKLHAMLTDVMLACPEGRQWPVTRWKRGFMSYLGHEVAWFPGLDGGEPFPDDLRTSRLTKRQCADLITAIQEYGDRHGVAWSEPEPEGMR